MNDPQRRLLVPPPRGIKMAERQRRQQLKPSHCVMPPRDLSRGRRAGYLAAFVCFQKYRRPFGTVPSYRTAIL
eukprot:scaffold268089_cov45-Prasinocladus_malaysianus.AAC.2